MWDFPGYGLELESLASAGGFFGFSFFFFFFLSLLVLIGVERYFTVVLIYNFLVIYDFEYF